MKIVIFSGTTEGRDLSRRLADAGAAVTVSVATDYGREEQGTYPGLSVSVGRKDVEAMVQLLADCDFCIDATHPYAQEATVSIQAAARRQGIPYRRLMRPAETLPSASIVVNSADEAAAYLVGKPGAVLLTTGVKDLASFALLKPERIYPRILPTVEGLQACLDLGIPRSHIIAMQGPFSQELNEALIQQCFIRFLVTKEGGAAGGFREKVDAAVSQQVELVVIRRPDDAGVSFEELLAECEELLS